MNSRRIRRRRGAQARGARTTQIPREFHDRLWLSPPAALLRVHAVSEHSVRKRSCERVRPAELELDLTSSTRIWPESDSEAHTRRRTDFYSYEVKLLGMSTNGLPSDVDDDVVLFHRIWREFEDGWFSVQEFSHRLLWHEDDVQREKDPKQALNRLVAYGLLRRTDDDRYKIHCKPGDSVAEWHAKIRSRVEAIHQRIHNTEQYESHRSTVGERKNILRHNGNTYFGVSASEDTEFRDLVKTLKELLERGTAHAGVVLRAPATEAAKVQGTADRLYDPNEMAELSCPFCFEKEYSEVVGENKDTLEYRLFLIPESR